VQTIFRFVEDFIRMPSNTCAVISSAVVRGSNANDAAGVGARHNIAVDLVSRQKSSSRAPFRFLPIDAQTSV
jgi:hypothetical protein